MFDCTILEEKFIDLPHAVSCLAFSVIYRLCNALLLLQLYCCCFVRFYTADCNVAHHQYIMFTYTICHTCSDFLVSVRLCTFNFQVKTLNIKNYLVYALKIYTRYTFHNKIIKAHLMMKICVLLTNVDTIKQHLQGLPVLSGKQFIKRCTEFLHTRQSPDYRLPQQSAMRDLRIFRA